MASNNKRIKLSFDPLDLIELIEQPCLWDKTSEEYKDRAKKGRAWKKVYQYLIQDNDDLEENDKLAAGNTFNFTKHKLYNNLLNIIKLVKTILDVLGDSSKFATLLTFLFLVIEKKLSR